ncbi:hypothetical protein N7486_003788 [Penicillium sp. IBT 16267x]|nr:hypothetical protein N7486_003788 [Penicillium sp. IBT 16267x]
MPVYRIILFRLKPHATEAQKSAFFEESHKLKGVIPGIVSLELGPAMDMARTKGFDYGIVLCLEGPEYLDIFAKHPAHLKLHDIREEMCDDSLAFNIQF